MGSLKWWIEPVAVPRAVVWAAVFALIMRTIVIVKDWL